MGEVEWTWTIENISYWNRDIHGKVISAPISDFGCLELYPRGLSGDEKHMELRRDKYSVPFSILEAIERGCELIYTNTLGSMARARQTEHNQFQSFVGPEFEEVVDDDPWENQPDHLVLRLGQSSTPPMKLQSQIDVLDTSVQFSADTFKNVPYRKNEAILRMVYNLEGGRRECVNVLASTLSYDNGVATVRLFLEPEYHDNVFSFRCYLSFQPDLPNNETNAGTHCTHVPSNAHSAKRVFRQNEIWEFGQLGVSKRTCGTYVLRLIFVSGYKYVSTEISFPPKQVAVDPPNSSLSSGTALSKDLTSLFGDKDFSDVLLHCSNVSFRAHRAILSFRSPVFKYLLSNDQRSLDIEDLDVPTLALFLSFLYSGTTGDLQWDNALKLYNAANVYHVPTLKNECSVHLRTNVSVQNVCDALSLADAHKDPYLTSAMHDFIVDHFNDVSRSKGWTILMHKNPILVSKTVTHLGKKNRVEKSYAQ